MKNILISALLLGSFAASAQTPKPQADFCEVTSELAEMVMDDRQQGLSKDDIHEKLVLMNGNNKSQAFLYFLSEMFNHREAAFQIPVAQSDAERVTVIQKFKENALRECLAKGYTQPAANDQKS